MDTVDLGENPFHFHGWNDGLQKLFERIDKNRDGLKRDLGERAGEVIGMGYCLDMILSMKKVEPSPSRPHLPCPHCEEMAEALKELYDAIPQTGTVYPNALRKALETIMKHWARGEKG